ncbi:MAG: hypothetical protein UT63_C0025G0005 [Candidatus Gottesmanbacteria bacterium GW2011_GWC2_39_8]|uniref:PIN domain-containing protein n=1 Tax=Candidatus Gottesmanbacteria bacterium GW2011_GWC2_39_8 TaxID=1618450 RepID=A0A0G0PYQ6_9BACT|nr:MAG: hypothetical protein UT63_C0025G0005 [Candidatus Gottesmanbacteria bacterium GW2011_GWC2_39_8]
MKEILLDTNIFIRFFVKDIKPQFEESYKLFGKIEKGETRAMVSILVINEIVWVLENYYELSRKIYIPILVKLLALKGIKIKETKKKILMKILGKMKEKKLDFTDLYLIENREGKEIVFFDKELQKFQKVLEKS